MKGKHPCKVFLIVLKSSSDQLSGIGSKVGFCSRPHLNTCSQTSISFILKSSRLIKEIKDFSEREAKSGVLNIWGLCNRKGETAGKNQIYFYMPNMFFMLKYVQIWHQLIFYFSRFPGSFLPFYCK